LPLSECITIGNTDVVDCNDIKNTPEIHLNGKIYVNGILFEPSGTCDTNNLQCKSITQEQNKSYKQISFGKKADFKINYSTDDKYNEINGEFKAYSDSESISNITGKVIGQVLDYERDLVQLDLLVSFDIDNQIEDSNTYKAKLCNKNKSIYYRNAIDMNYAKIDYFAPTCRIKKNKTDNIDKHNCKYNIVLSITCADTQIKNIRDTDIRLSNLERLLKQFFKGIKINLKQKN